MITNEDRRRMAQNLRGGFDIVGDAGGRFWLNGTLFGLDISARSEERVRGGLYHLADLIEPEKITGDTSDGYHTFSELYDHRAKLFSVIVRDHREIAWKSRLHHDGTMYDGMFIVGVETPEGQATYHYDVDPYWDLFDCEELDRAPEWDGHTPQQAIDRIAALRPSCDRDALQALAEKVEKDAAYDEGCEDLVSAWYMADVLHDVAMEIREACGEAVA